MTTSNPTEALASAKKRLSQITAAIKICQQLYESPNITGSLLMQGRDVNTRKPFTSILNFDQLEDIGTDDLRKFFNNYGATLISHKLIIEDRIKQLQFIVDELQPAVERFKQDFTTTQLI